MKLIITLIGIVVLAANGCAWSSRDRGSNVADYTTSAPISNDVECYAIPALQEIPLGASAQTCVTLVNIGTQDLYYGECEWPLAPWNVISTKDGKLQDYSERGRDLRANEAMMSWHATTLPPKGRISVRIPLSEFFDLQSTGRYDFRLTRKVWALVNGKNVEFSCKCQATVAVK